MKPRSLNFARSLAGIYLAWSLFVYFGTLGRNGHDWWPLFLYFIIWPLSTLWEYFSSLCFQWLVPSARTAPGWVWALNDYIAGAFYIIGGTIWIWFVGRVITRVMQRNSIVPLGLRNEDEGKKRGPRNGDGV